MKLRKIRHLSIILALIAFFGSTTVALASVATLSTATTSLGKIVINGKGMTAYFYDLDKVNAKVSACSGECSVNWPPIISTTTKPKLAGITGKVTVLTGSKQIAINGRLIYTFSGDSRKGSTNGQGIGNVWYVISPSGKELKNISIQSSTPQAHIESTPNPTPSVFEQPSISPSPAETPTPTDNSTSGTYIYNY